jgi:hypothetical protein
MRIHVDLGQHETADPHVIASELLLQGADRDDEQVTIYAGDRPCS